MAGRVPSPLYGGFVRGNRALVIGAAGVALLAAGWFVMSHTVMGTTIPDALGEAMGVALGLSVFLSIIGAFVSGRQRSRRDRSG